MREMKDSGIPWIGTIPVNWVVRPVKSAFYRKKEKAQQENPTVLSLARSGVKVRDIENNEGQLAQSYYDYNPVVPGDLLINPMDLYSGANCNMSEVKGVISPAYVNLRARDGYDPKYYDYYFKTQYWAMAFFAHGLGVSYNNRWTLNNETLQNYKIPVPTYKEQVMLSAYLDTKLALIDNVIEKTKQSIDEYKKYKQSLITETITSGLNPDVKMRDSGIEWVGKIPEHWKVVRIKNLLFPHEKPINDSDEIITCYRSGQVTLRSNVRDEGYTFSETEKGYQGVDVDDVVIHGMDAFGGAIGISDSRGKCTPVYHVCSSSQNKKYIVYYLRMMANNDVLMALSSGVRIRSSDYRNWNKLAIISSPLPPIDEQILIADFLDKKIYEIDRFIEKKNAFIGELEQYKKSFVYEVVTGKKEVQ